MSFFRKIYFIFIIFTIFFQNTNAEEEFIIEDIILEGLQRVDPGSIYGYLPFEVGDTFDSRSSPTIIKTLFKSRFFNDIVIKRDGNKLVIIFDERPTIVDIDFEGLEDIDDEQLDKILDAANIAPGRIYDSSILEKIKSELREQNFARGIYSVDIKIEENLLPENRIYLKVIVSTGVRAKIKQIKITGNRSFSDKKLKKNFETALPVWYMFWSTRGVYSSPMLQGDLNRLESFYQDKGFMDFTIESTQVSLSKSKEEVYITININEGEQFIVEKIHVSGKLIAPIEEIANLIEVKTGQYISKSKILQSTESIKERLSEEGYAFSRVNAVPDKMNGGDTIDLNFYIDPGNRAYVRRIHISGNTTTQDEVLRREMRQMEGGWYSSSAIETSKRRLRRLSYIENVIIEEVRVPGSTNKIDLHVKVKEKLSGNVNIGAGLGGSGTGVSLSAGVSQDNFLGFGSKVSLSFDTGKTTKDYTFNFYNPYHNLDSVSRSFGFSFQDTQTDNTDTVSDYEADKVSLDYSYGLPMTENNLFTLQLNYLNWEVAATSNSADEIVNFINKNGSKFHNFSFNVRYAIDTRDSSAFTRSGFKTSVGAEVFVPGSDLEYYMLQLRSDSWFEINRERDLILKLKGLAYYGQGYGGTDGLPFYEKFKMGGPKTIRGYRKNSVSPLDSTGKPLGGDFAVAGSTELIFTPPFELPFDNLKTALFADFGASFKDYDSANFGDIKGSIGLSIKWISPFGGISISLSSPLNKEDSDKTESFQFNLGTN